MMKDSYLTITLDNYDNNRYSRILNLTDSAAAISPQTASATPDTLHATFGPITMEGKDPDSPAFLLILNNRLTII